MSRFSDYIVYVDESDSRDCDNIDPENPLFVQNFCIFDKQHYSKVVVPQIQQLKLRHFGHDAFALSAEDFHQQRGIFETLHGSNQRQQFINEINKIIENSNFVLIACIVDKRIVDKRNVDKRNAEKEETQNQFDAALSFCLDHSYRFLQEREQVEGLTHIVVAKQSGENDEAFQSLFRKLCDQNIAASTNINQTLPFELQLVDQGNKPLGLQLSSFITRAIIDHVIQPDQSNPTFEILKPKFYCKGGRNSVGEGFEGWGLKRFPS